MVFMGSPEEKPTVRAKQTLELLRVAQTYTVNCLENIETAQITAFM